MIKLSLNNASVSRKYVKSILTQTYSACELCNPVEKNKQEHSSTNKKCVHMRDQAVAEQRVSFKKVRKINSDTDVPRACELCNLVEKTNKNIAQPSRCYSFQLTCLGHGSKSVKRGRHIRVTVPGVPRILMLEWWEHATRPKDKHQGERVPS